MTRKPASAVRQTKSPRPKKAVSAPALSVNADISAPAFPPPSPAVAVEIDPVVPGGYAANRFDCMIRGHVVSFASIQEIRLLTEHGLVATSSWAQADRVPAAVTVDGSPVHQRTFHFNLPWSHPGETEQFACQIVARLDGGFEHIQDYVIQLDPAAESPVGVVSGPTRSMAAGPKPQGVLYIERATINGDGMLSVQGWAVALGAILAVQIFAGADPVATAVFGGAREDVAAAFPAYPNAHASGFTLKIQMEEANRSALTLRAQAICAGGFSYSASTPIEHVPATTPNQAPAAPAARLARRKRTPSAEPKQSGNGRARSGSGRMGGPAEIIMYCDSAELAADGLLSVDGWAVCADGIAQIRVLLDDTDVGLATFGHQRADVGSLHTNVPMSHLSGFRFERRVAYTSSDRHVVRVVVCGAKGNETVEDVDVVMSAGSDSTDDGLPLVDQQAPPKDTPEQSTEFRFELDQPSVTDDIMVDLVTGRLTIEGWLLTRSGIASFEVMLDDQRLGDAHYGLARQDVGAAFPEWPNSLRSGFAFHCPPRSLRDGSHTVRLAIQANNGVTMERSFQITVKKSDDEENSVSIRRRIPRVEIDMMLDYLSETATRPTIDLILRQNGPFDADRLGLTLETLRQQAYPDWTAVVLVADSSDAAAVLDAVQGHSPDLVDRFRVLSPADIAAWSAPLAQSKDGRSVLHVPLCLGDQLGADALLNFAVLSSRNTGHDLFYADEVRVSPVSKEKEPFFKPNFSPDLLFSTNYIGRPWAGTADLVARSGASPASLMHDGDYDLVLRCAEAATGIFHVPKLLCQRGPSDADDAAQEQHALTQVLARRSIAGEVLPTPIAGTWRVRRALPAKGKVSIIIPTCAAHGYIGTCIDTIRAKTTYPDYEIVVIDNIPDDEPGWKTWLVSNADKIVDIPDAFNWSVFNNRAADAASGDYLLFLNDDIEITHGDWLDALMEHAQRPDVAVVGPQLLYRDGKVQHAGMFLGHNGVGRHAFRFAAGDDPGYFGLARTQRNVIAVTGACMLVRRATFDVLGRFDEAHDIINNDLDFCLRAHRAGLLTVYTPYASLIHYELASRAGLKDAFDSTQFSADWKTLFAAGDPYFSQRLTRSAEDYRPDDEPVQWVVAGSPIFHVAEIQRILVVKLDHIGDFVTALPAIRRLRSVFPAARITVLAGPGSRDFIALEPSIDEFIPFSFFHARSQLGERELTDEDYAGLAAQLRPYRFDLAVDLRKHPSTRDVLKYTGARFLAGYDYAGQFPFLDVALDWDGDRTLQRKRHHIVDDLLALVDAIEHATENDRLLMQPGPVPLPLADLPAEVQALFERPVVAMHPGAGNITKQWPVGNFSALIDLLIEKNGVNVLLVGGPDDVAVADELAAGIINHDAVASMAGKTSLAVLARMLKNCVLYIGNDSGPKHIAAAVGVPTLGIHSGVVDPVEWGPIGPNAVALRRNMACSPCYLANADDCSRGLACLRLFDPSTVYEAANLMLNPARTLPVSVKPTERLPALPAKAARKAKSRRKQPIVEPA